eukprot:1194579-Prorocentrum_minimum.AAC.2
MVTAVVTGGRRIPHPVGELPTSAANSQPEATPAKPSPPWGSHSAVRTRDARLNGQIFGVRVSNCAGHSYPLRRARVFTGARKRPDLFTHLSGAVVLVLRRE